MAERTGDAAKLVEPDVLPAFRVGNRSAGNTGTLGKDLLAEMTFTAKLAKLARHGFEVRDGVG